MADWSKIETSMSIEVKAIRKRLRGYSYIDDSTSAATDDKFCNYIIEQIRQAKDTLFHIIQNAYELHEESLDKYFQGLRDDLDIFSDEIKIRSLEWSKNFSQEWMRRLVKHDYNLVNNMDKLNNDLRDTHSLFLKVIQLYPKKTDPNQLARIRKLIKLLEKAIDEIVLTFKEREVICNLKPMALEKTYSQMQDYYRRLI